MSTFKSDSGGYSRESIYGSHVYGHDLKSFTGDSSKLDFIHGSRWWLNQQALGGEYSHEQLNVFRAEANLSEAGDVDLNGKLGGENKLIEDYCTACPKRDADSCVHAMLKQCSQSKNKEDSWLQEFEATVVDDLLSNVDLMDLVSSDSLLLERSKKLSSEVDSHWIGLKKTEPWWHAGDKDELASLVSQTSSHDIRDNDGPGAQTFHVEKIDNQVDSFDQLNEQIANEAILNAADCSQGSVTSSSLGKFQTKQGLMDCLQQESGVTYSFTDDANTTSSNKEGSNTTRTDSSDAQESTTSALSRAQLLEALCHSQTRAREAEKLAQTACNEKDHVINLFFQQASSLFAYRQWLRLLQLESLCLHLRSKSQLPPLIPPSFLPWARNNGTIARKNRHRAAKKKQGKQRCHVRKCAIAFAVGLSLAGAGLLVGWTIGWLFPAF
ncbi:uncharacterized protein LOC127244885 [Andrographis paniculata]|uniref:uncharacterized protein LOC127244885 n=1 Tax=Andrographis paniculata TaxID=175694 RepID=UPI0021E80710|nr:uncharacterized protein LOC127244885 [Andrographis paniculata]